MGLPTGSSQPELVSDKRSTSDAIDIEKNAPTQTTEIDGDPKAESGYDSEEYTDGVKRVRGITETWSRKTLVLMFGLLYLVSFVDMLLVNVQSSLNPYITSTFGRHGLLASTSVVSTILGGAAQLTLAKIVDLWGRVWGFLVMLGIVIIGQIMKATCDDIETYIGAHTLYWVGHLGMMYVVNVMISDMTTLQNRMVVYGLIGTPTIANTFIGPKVADLFYNETNFRWAYGGFAIILAGICIPAAAVMLWMEHKAAKTGNIVKEPSGRNLMQSIKYYVVQFDLLGQILLIAIFALTMLPMNIDRYAPNGWNTPYIIAMLVLGVLLIPAFYVWERYFTPVQFLPWKYLTDPTILGSSFLYGSMFTSIFCWNAYYGSYLQVVHRLSITDSGYVLNAMSLTSSVFSPIFGLIISYTGNFKYTAWAGIPFLLVGTAILIPLRQPDTNPGVLALTQILVGFGSGIFATCGQLGVMAPVTHQQIAVVIAIFGLFGSVGATIGISIAGALWNNVFPVQLHNRLPEELKNQTQLIFGDIVTQMSFEDGTAARDAVVGAYADVQRKMVIAGACFAPLCVLSIWVWRNINVKELEKKKGAQTKGNVF